MTLRERLFYWLVTLASLATTLAMCGLVAHLAWICISFGWALVP